MIKACRARSRQIVWLAVSSDCDQHRPRRQRLAPDFLGDRKTIHHRQPDVEHHHIKALIDAQQRFGAVVTAFDAIALGFEQQGQHLGRRFAP